MYGLSDFEDVSTELELQFTAAANLLQQLVGSLDQATLLRFYGLYKQSTVGPCNTPKPGLFALQAKAKWYAWHELGSMTADEAMHRYVQHMDELRPGWQTNAAAENGSASGGVGTAAAGWVAVSRLSADPDEVLDDAQKTCADYVKEGNRQRTAELLSTVADVNALDGEGMALIHWAADRGSVDVLREVLAAGADVDARDANGQTALHYACSVGHVECVLCLVSAGAQRSLPDGEGVTCAEVAASVEIRALVLDG